MSSGGTSAVLTGPWGKVVSTGGTFSGRVPGGGRVSAESSDGVGTPDVAEPGGVGSGDVASGDVASGDVASGDDVSGVVSAGDASGDAAGDTGAVVAPSSAAGPTSPHAARTSTSAIARGVARLIQL